MLKKKVLTGFVLLVIFFSAAACKVKTVPIKDDGDIPKKTVSLNSYLIGRDIAEDLKYGNYPIDQDAVIKGLIEGLASEKINYSYEEIEKIQKDYQDGVQRIENKRAEKNKNDGLQFLEKNKEDSEIVILPSGLQYKVIKDGNGLSPALDDTVKIHFIGKTIDGKEYDNSYKLKKPAELLMSNIAVKGVQEALQLMKVGAKWQLFIPSELAYGEKGLSIVAPYSAIVFEVELLSIEKRS